MPHARRVAVVTLVVVLAGAALLAILPGSLATVRLGGVGLLWWYATLATPLVAAAAIVTALSRARRAGDDEEEAAGPGAGGGLAARDVALWSSPALLASLGALVFAGAPAAPLVAIAALAAPLAGRLLGANDAGPPHPVEQAATIAGAALLVCAELVVAGDVALALGLARRDGIAAAAAIAAAVVLVPFGARVRDVALAAGALAVALPVALVWSETTTPPWSAWSQAAARPSIAFEARSPSVTRGVTARMPATFRFSEPQRITVLTEGVYRVVERDGVRPVLREWRLAAGQSLPVRGGDELALSVGATVRFEPGKRVPGAPASGTAWADAYVPTPFGALATFLGAVLTLGGVCAGRSGPEPRRATAALAAVTGLVVVGAVVCWGVYAALAGPDLALGGPLVGTLVRAPDVLVPSASRVPAALLVAGGAALLVAVTSALHARATAAVGRAGMLAWQARLGWIALVVAAAVGAAVRPVDGWRFFTLGAGLAASVLVAPRLIGVPAARTAAAVAGAVAFVGLALAAGELREVAPVVAEYPALLAAPLAWAVGWLFDRKV